MFRIEERRRFRELKNTTFEPVMFQMKQHRLLSKVLGAYGLLELCWTLFQ
jgi:hypothetical protein